MCRSTAEPLRTDMTGIAAGGGDGRGRLVGLPSYRDHRPGRPQLQPQRSLRAAMWRHEGAHVEFLGGIRWFSRRVVP